ncbi:ketoacyl-ACP synthase III family protein [Streptomyces capitiformicae]|nr:ketoacyl-ACP synthase III family protein [Streptomyces capitiformicae]
MKTEDVYIDAVGVHLPDEWVSAQQAIETGLFDEDSVQYATELTGSYIAGDVPAVDMAVFAARQALERSGTDATALGFHVHCSASEQGPESFYPPGYVLRELGAHGVSSVDVHQNSDGMLAAFEVAVGQLTGAARASRVLVTAGENFSSPLIDRWQGFGTGFSASDGGAAVLFSDAGGFAALRALNSGTLPELEQWHRGEKSLLPHREPMGKAVSGSDMLEMLWYFNDEVIPLDKCLQMIRDFESDLMRRSLDDAGLDVGDVAWVLTANTNLQMMEQMKLEPLGLPLSRSNGVFARDFGHIGACDIPVSLDHLLASGKLSPGDNILMTTSGAGWVSTSAVITVLDLPSWAGTGRP